MHEAANTEHNIKACTCMIKSLKLINSVESTFDADDIVSMSVAVLHL